MKTQLVCSPVEAERLKAFLKELDEYERFAFTTSGSTGKPKELAFSKAQLLTSAEQTISAFGLKPTDVLLCPLALHYVAGKMMVVRAWHLGAKLLYCGASRNPFEIVGKEKVDFAAFVPLQVESMLQEPEAVEWLNGMKTIIIGGAPVSPELEKQVQRQLQVPVFHTYGMTETLTHVALKALNGTKADGFYHALPKVALRTDAQQCLQVKSPVQPAWLSTTDVVELEGNRFKWLGRADFVINSGGFKIHPEKVEQIMAEVMGIIGVLVGLPDEQFGERAVWVMEAKENTLSVAQMQHKLQASLHPYEMPRQLVQVAQFPRLPNGKLDRLAIKKALLQR